MSLLYIPSTYAHDPMKPSPIILNNGKNSNY